MLYYKWGEVMLHRKAYDKLVEWKNSAEKKALCIIGARQIGKTTLIRKFGQENYAHFVEINFIADPEAAQIFDGPLDADTLITNLSAYTRRPMEPGETLILFDEVQECPSVRTAIKFLVEDGQFDYIESGSLLGVRHKEVRSYPVGFEEIYRMYPMDLEEYFWANGVQPETITHLKKCFESRVPVSQAIHDTMNKLFFGYIVVGGMPDVVQTYVDTHDIAKVVAKQNEILELYRLDIAKYAETSDKPKIRAIFDAIPSQLNDKNRRFFLNHLDANARQLRYADSFQWLAQAGVALPCYNVTAPQPPLQLNEKHNLFKLFMGDVGLLCAACIENVQFAILKGDLSINMGSILENVVAQQLRCNGLNLHFFDSKKYGELDFVVQNGLHVELIEVKSGKDYKNHPALNKVLSVDEWDIEEAYVLCPGNLEVNDGITYLPWYMSIFLKPAKLPKEWKFEIDLSGLNAE